ncbi:hypothetical protein CJF30_00009416 [Rutstroemia sp. NJR-2017a BBW]|nr:hypothetical protein CJF30_00009416 [Rutstroemia sp. NJR-2017a BBW]
MDNIYVAHLEGTGVRFSYTSLCAPSLTSSHTCGPSVGKSARSLLAIYNLTTPLPTIQYALDLQTNTSFVIPALSSVLFLSALFTLMHARSIVKRSGVNTRFHINLICALFWASSGVAFAAAYAVTSAGAALAVRRNGLGIETGKAMLALQWMVWVLSLLAAVMSGGITKTFLKSAGRRRRGDDQVRSVSRSPVRTSFPRHRSIVDMANGSRAPPYSREPQMRAASPVSPI